MACLIMRGKERTSKAKVTIGTRPKGKEGVEGVDGQEGNERMIDWVRRDWE